ncbi:UPF0488 protein C8orf33 homolog [Ylistrum balloti]|uniref:UPF0488 protein C8orf33 homolog n=1 Tax=Ylistrum balloti TaxID=509963 RepID=UPI0029058BAE|nr:UPF0488 protein C8orf33 homolog [Ylistrum balloti]
MADKMATEDQFIRELHWCVEQLHLGLETQNPDSKQAREAQKMLKILCSDKAPVIKKRQVMRNAFGDYRQKMLNAEKKSAAKLKKSKMTPTMESNGQKSVFYRKSASKQYNNQSSDGTSMLTNQQLEKITPQPSSMGDNSQEKGDDSVKNEEDVVSERLEKFTFVKSDGDFKFSFQSPTKSFDDLDTDNVDKNSSICNTIESLTTENFVMQKTDNAFRFNFTEPT